MHSTQNIFTKSAGVTMGMPRKGWSVSRCFLSPVITQAAWHPTANSSTMLSSVSFEVVIFSCTSTFLAWVSSRKISSSRSSSLAKYLSNFFQKNTSVNSSISESEIAIVPRSTAWSNACALTEWLDKVALISALVSKTKTLGWFIQNIIQNLLRKAALGHLCTQFFQVGQKFFVRVLENFFANPHAYPLGNLFPACGREPAPRECNLGSTSITIRSIAFHLSSKIKNIYHSFFNV